MPTNDEPKPGGHPFADLLSQLRSLPDDLRDAVLDAVEGSKKVEVPGVDLLVNLIRSQQIQAATLRAAMAPEVQQPPLRRPTTVDLPDVPPARRRSGPAIEPVVSAGADVPPRRSVDLLDLASVSSKAQRREANASQLLRDLEREARARRPDAAVQPAQGDLPFISDRVRRAPADVRGLFDDPPGRRAKPSVDSQPIPASTRRGEADVWGLFREVLGKRSPGDLPNAAPGPASWRGLMDDPPKRNLPSTDDLFNAFAKAAGKPVANAFEAAIKSAPGWRRVNAAFEGLANFTNITRATGGLSGVGGGLPGLAFTAAIQARGLVRQGGEEAAKQAEANRPLGQFNGAIATSYVQLEMGNLRRQMDASHALEKSVVGLNRTVDLMRDAQQDSSVFWQGLGNRTATAKAGLEAALSHSTAGLYRAGTAAMDAIDPDGDRLGKLGRGLGALLGSPVGSLLDPRVGDDIRAGLQGLGFQVAGGAPQNGAQRHVLGWQQELLNIANGNHLRRAGMALVHQNRPGRAARAGAAGVGGIGGVRPNGGFPAAMQWNQNIGLPGRMN